MSAIDTNKFRRLSDQFMQDLQDNKRFLSLKNMVKNDNSLSLEIRNNYINVYYRGGNLLKLSEVNKHCYKPIFNVKYSRKTDIIDGLPKEISSKSQLAMWLERFPGLKSEMDSWFSKYPKFEREFQQKVVWGQNNFL